MERRVVVSASDQSCLRAMGRRLDGYISRVFRVPNVEQAVQGPFCTAYALLLILLRVLGREGFV